MTTISLDNVLDTVANDFDYSINKFPLFGPDNMPTEAYGLFRSDNSKHIGRVCAKGYVPHTTDDVLALTEAACNVFDGEVRVRTHFDNGHYVDITPSDENRLSIYNGRDSMFPRFMINGSYNGRGFSASLGYYRDLCKNLAMMRKASEGSHVSIHHSSKLRGRMNDLIETFSTLKESWQTMSSVITELSEIPLNVDRFMREVYKEPEGKSTRYENKIEKVIRRLAKESHRLGQPDPTETQEASAWLLFNAVQGYEQHDATRSKSTSDFGRAIKAENESTRKAERIVSNLVA